MVLSRCRADTYSRTLQHLCSPLCSSPQDSASNCCFRAVSGQVNGQPASFNAAPACVADHAAATSAQVKVTPSGAKQKAAVVNSLRLRTSRKIFHHLVSVAVTHKAEDARAAEHFLQGTGSRNIAMPAAIREGIDQTKWITESSSFLDAQTHWCPLTLHLPPRLWWLLNFLSFHFVRKFWGLLPSSKLWDALDYHTPLLPQYPFCPG